MKGNEEEDLPGHGADQSLGHGGGGGRGTGLAPVTNGAEWDTRLHTHCSGREAVLSHEMLRVTDEEFAQDPCVLPVLATSCVSSLIVSK